MKSSTPSVSLRAQRILDAVGAAGGMRAIRRVALLGWPPDDGLTLANEVKRQAQTLVAAADAAFAN